MLQKKDCAKCGVNQADRALIALPMIFLCDDCYSKQESLEERIEELGTDLKSARAKYDLYKIYAEDKVKSQAERIKELEQYKDYVESRISECKIPNEYLPLCFEEWDKIVSELANDKGTQKRK